MRPALTCCAGHVEASAKILDSMCAAPRPHLLSARPCPPIHLAKLCRVRPDGKPRQHREMQRLLLPSPCSTGKHGQPICLSRRYDSHSSRGKKRPMRKRIGAQTQQSDFDYIVELISDATIASEKEVP